MARPIMRRLLPLVRPLPCVLVSVFLFALGPPTPSAIAQESPTVLLTLLSQTSWNCPTATADLEPGQTTWSCPPGRELVVRFRAQNLGATPIDELAIGVTLYSRVLTRSAYEASLASDPSIVIDRDTLPREGPIAPGETRDFEVSLTLGPGIDPDHSGVLPAQARPPRAAIESVAALRTPVIYLVREPEIPLGLSWTFVLSHPITFAPDGTFTDPSLEIALGPGGRLNGEIRSLLEFAADPAGPHVDVAIAPVLLTQLGRMVDGYRVAEEGGDRQVAPGEGGSALAKQALDDLRTIVAAPNVEVTALPFSAPEIPSLYGGGLGRDVVVQLQRGRDVTSTLVGAQIPETILRPPGAALDDTTLRGLAADGIRTLIVGPIDRRPARAAARVRRSADDRAGRGIARGRRSRTGERRPPRIGGRRGSGPRGAGAARRARDDLAGAARRDAGRRAGVRRGRAAPRSVLPADGPRRRDRSVARSHRRRRVRRDVPADRRVGPRVALVPAVPDRVRRLAQAGEEADRDAGLDAARRTASNPTGSRRCCCSRRRASS